MKRQIEHDLDKKQFLYNFQIKTIRHELYNHPKRSLSRVDDDIVN